MRCSVSVLGFALLCGGALCGVPVASAQEPASSAAPDSASVAEAQALFRRGIELGAENRWADALEYFRRSNARVPRPSTLFNIGVALGRLGRFVEAIAIFDELAAGEPPPEAARLEAERLRAEAIASLGELTIELVPEDGLVFVDGDRTEGSGSPRVIPLDPGRHVLRVTAEGHAEGGLEVSLLPAEHTRGRIVLERLAIPVDEVDGSVPVVTGGSIADEPAFWIVGGVILVAIGAGVGIGVGLATAQAPQYGGTTGVVLLTP